MVCNLKRGWAELPVVQLLRLEILQQEQSLTQVLMVQQVKFYLQQVVEL